MKHDKSLTGILTDGLLVILCCALPALLPIVAGVALFTGPAAPWIIGAVVFLGLLLLISKMRRARTRQTGSCCGPTSISTNRGKF